MRTPLPEVFLQALLAHGSQAPSDAQYGYLTPLSMLQDVSVHVTAAQEVLVLGKLPNLERIDTRVARKLDSDPRPFARQICAAGATTSWCDDI